MNLLAVNYTWSLPHGDADLARQIVAQLRERAMKMGLEPVGEIITLTGDEAAQDKRLPRRYVWTEGKDDRLMRPAQVVFFTATIPGSPPEQFGLALDADDSSWSWASVTRTSPRRFGDLANAAVELGLAVVFSFAGMTVTTRRNEAGEIEYEQKMLEFDEGF